MPENLYIVDKYDNVLGSATRQEIHNSDMWHRGIHIFLFNTAGHILLQIRSPRKDKFPNTFDCSVSEHVMFGESYEQAAYRGMNEELGIENIKLKPLLKFRMKYGPHDNMISTLFKGDLDNNVKIKIESSEIQSIVFLSLDDVKIMLAKDERKFAPWTRELLKWYLKLPSKVKKID